LQMLERRVGNHAGEISQEHLRLLEDLRDTTKELFQLPLAESYYLKAMNCAHHHRIFAA